MIKLSCNVFFKKYIVRYVTKMKKRIVSAILAVVMVLASLIAVAPTASAATGYDRGYTEGAGGTGKVVSKGIDISSYQGSNFNFTALKNCGYDYVILRCATGYNSATYVDPTFESNYTRAKAAGLGVGVYYFSYASTVAGVQKEMTHLLSVIKGKQFEYPVYFDFENADTKSAIGSSVTTAKSLCYTALDAIAEAGFLAGLYGYAGWFDPGYNGWFASGVAEIAEKYDVWIANYYRPTDETSYAWDHPKSTLYPTTYGMYQYSSDGNSTLKANVYNGKLDLNVCYKDYPSIVKKYGFSGYAAEGTLTTEDYVPYGETSTASWSAVANAASYKYKVTLYDYNWSESTAQVVYSGTTAAQSITIPAQSTGCYMKVEVTASNSSTPMVSYSRLGPGKEYINLSAVNGSINVSNSMIITSSQAATSPVYWLVCLCSPQGDGVYKVTKRWENETWDKAAKATGDDVLFAIHMDYANFDYAETNFAVGKTVTIAGVSGTSLLSMPYITLGSALPVQVEPLAPTDTNLSISGTCVKGVSAGASVSDFAASFNHDASSLVVKNASGTAVTTGTLATGYTVSLVINGSVIESYAVVVSGDINGDGLSTAADVLTVAMKIKSQATLSGAYLSAADDNGSGAVDSSDYLAIKELVD